MHIKIGDKIKVIAGNQKGLVGNISSIDKTNLLINVDSISPRIKQVKNKEGGEPKKMEIQIGIHLSNIMLWDTLANKANRIGYKIINGEKKRYFKKSGNII